MSRKVNIFINSEYKQIGETNNSFIVNIPDGIVNIYDDEEANLSVTSFNCFNSFYSCNVNSNYFQLVFKNPLFRVTISLDFYLNLGNPNVMDILNDINNQLSLYLTVTYNKIKNIFIFNRIYPTTDTNYQYMFIKPINCGTFFGMNNNTENLITTNSTSTKPINVNYITGLYICLNGLFFQNNNIANFDNGGYKVSNIIFNHIIESQKNNLIVYDNTDGCNNFNYKLNNINNIKYFNLTCYDQNMNVIPDMPNYYLNLQFNISKKDNNENLLKSIIEYERNIYLLLSYIAKL